MWFEISICDILSHKLFIFPLKHVHVRKFPQTAWWSEVQNSARNPVSQTTSSFFPFRCAFNTTISNIRQVWRVAAWVFLGSYLAHLNTLLKVKVQKMTGGNTFTFNRFRHVQFFCVCLGKSRNISLCISPQRSITSIHPSCYLSYQTGELLMNYSLYPYKQNNFFFFGQDWFYSICTVCYYISLFIMIFGWKILTVRGVNKNKTKNNMLKFCSFKENTMGWVLIWAEVQSFSIGKERVTSSCHLS